jgi:hypothetical protein
VLVRLLTFAAAALMIAGSTAPARAQSLAELARQEAERRKAIKDSAKVITNRDLPKTPLKPTGTSSDPGNSPTAEKPTTDSKKGQTPDDSTSKEPVKDQAYWAGRQKSLREQLDRDQVLADAMQSRINALTTDFVNRDDPAQRAVIANDRQRALAELDRLKKAIVDERKALADFEEEARRAGVPPGWLR